MRTYRLLVSPRAAAWSLAAAAAVVIMVGATPFSGAYLFVLTVLAFPFAVQLAFTTAGLLPAVGVALTAAAGVWRAVGMMPAVYTLCYLLPLVLLMAGCVYAKLPYQQTMAVLVLGYAAVVLVLYWFGQQALGGDIFGGLTDIAMNALKELPDRDLFLNSFYRYGLLSLPKELAENPLVSAPQGYTFAPQVLEEFYKQASARIDLWLRALLPTLLSSHSVTWGVLGFFVSMYYGTRRAHREAYFSTDNTQAEDLLPNLGQPVFSMWFLPKQLGYLLMVFLGLWLLTRLSAQDPALSLGGQMMYNVAVALFSVQGLSFVNFVQKKRDTRPRVRGLTMALFYLVVPMGMMLLGIYDQVANPRQLPRGGDDNQQKGGMDR